MSAPINNQSKQPTTNSAIDHAVVVKAKPDALHMLPYLEAEVRNRLKQSIALKMFEQESRIVVH